MEKKGILVVSFGTSYHETRRLTIDACEEKIANAFPEYELRRAYTSYKIINKLKERDNIIIDKPEEALLKMKEEGFSEVIVQPLHIIQGEEIHEKVLFKIRKFKKEFKIFHVGRPVLFYMDDYVKAVEGIKHQLPELRQKEAVLFMGHGSTHPANASYSCLQSMIDDEELPVYIGNVEGYPELEHIIPRLKKDRVEEVTLMPFMLVAGDHALNDMVSDDEDSWKSILQNEGFRVRTYLHGLGENSVFQDIYVKNAQDAKNGKSIL